MPTDTTVAKQLALVIRTATVRSRCRCAQELLGYRVEFRIGDTVAEASPTLPTTRAAAGWAVTEAAATYTGMRLVPQPNPDYRPDCSMAILPGDRYVEDIRPGHADDRYCLRCGIERVVAATREMS